MPAEMDVQRVSICRQKAKQTATGAVGEAVPPRLPLVRLLLHGSTGDARHGREGAMRLRDSRFVPPPLSHFLGVGCGSGQDW